MKTEITTKSQRSVLTARLFSALLTPAALSIAMFALAGAGCSRVENRTEKLAPSAVSSWQPDGSLAFSRPVPEAAEMSPQTMLGFLPTTAAHVGTWLSIDTAQKKLTLFDGEKTVASANAQGIESLKPGIYQVLHKQRNALWYAPDSYYEKRDLKIPPTGDKARFLRGALGDFVIYLSKDTPIHSGPIWSEDVGGIKLEEVDLSRIYYTLPVGSPIEIK